MKRKTLVRSLAILGIIGIVLGAMLPMFEAAFAQ